MPSTVDEYYRMCTMERFRAAMVKYVDAIATSNVTLDMSSCPSCASGRIVPVELHRQSFKKPRSGAKRPTTSLCDQCSKDFGAGELITQHAEQVESSLNSSSGDSSATFRYIARSQPLPRVNERFSTDASIVSRALMSYQHHHWFHSKSCFKKTKRTPKGHICRMFMPKQVCAETRWTADNRIEMKREPVNEYVNTYVPVINAVFKCNHDIKFLGAGEGTFADYCWYVAVFLTVCGFVQVLKRHITPLNTPRNLNKTSRIRGLCIFMHSIKPTSESMTQTIHLQLGAGVFNRCAAR